QSLENSNDLKLIGRKLHSFLEKRPGKIEIITTHSEVHSKENSISILESSLPGSSAWVLYPKYVQITNAAESEPIQKCRSLAEVLCWLLINGLYHNQLHLNFISHSLEMSDQDLRSTLRQINLFLTHNFDFDPPLLAYQTVKTSLNSLILINLGISNNERLVVMSERSDALSYGANRQCFIHTIDRISLSSWGEITTSQGEGIEGLFDYLTDIINNNKKPLSPDILKFVCHTPNRARGILFRVEAVFNILVKLFSKHHHNRYILPGGTSFYVFQFENKTLRYRELSTKRLLLNELASPQAQFSTVYFDQAILENTPIHLIYSLNRPQAVQLFYYESKSDTSIYIVDEKGTLYTQRHCKEKPIHLLNHYSTFLESIINRNLFDSFLTVDYYEITKNSAGIFSYNPVQPEVASSNKKLSLRITGEVSNKDIIYTIYCNEEEFSSLDHGNQVFYAAYHYILGLRGGEINYPIHITDIDVPLSVFRINDPEQLQTIHYLNYKQKIENKFNI
ncbi:MAG: class I adenylate cyclase, partial [Methylobacter sp.]|nr:class I adenylate cyclase [Methylobacter sp.]